jgi:hypothetical protein
MISPLQYEARYKTLRVEFIATDTPPVTLSIAKYRLGKMTPEGSRFVTAARDYLHQQQKKAFDFTLALIVNGQPATFGMWEDLAPHVQPPFSGKGSPEDCQIVAQMAVLLNRTTAANLQNYCDSNIGLDCNGFVGNYLWHVRGKKDWMEIAGERDLGPGMSIDGFFDKGRPIGGLDKIQPAELNVFGLVSSTSRQIVPVAVWNPDGTLKESGHIVITEPGRFVQATDSAKNTFLRGLYGVESTGVTKTGVEVGLTDDWCTITEYIDPATKTTRNVVGYAHNRIFNIHRNSKNQDDLFAICAFSLT